LLLIGGLHIPGVSRTVLALTMDSWMDAQQSHQFFAKGYMTRSSHFGPMCRPSCPPMHHPLDDYDDITLSRQCSPSSDVDRDLQQSPYSGPAGRPASSSSDEELSFGRQPSDPDSTLPSHTLSLDWDEPLLQHSGASAKKQDDKLQSVRKLVARKVIDKPSKVSWKRGVGAYALEQEEEESFCGMQ